MSKQIPLSDYIQIHRRIRATRRDYYANTWRLLLPPFIAFFALGFALQSLVLEGIGGTGSSFVLRSLVFLLFAIVAFLDGPKCLERRRQIVYDEWTQDHSD
ncbi:MAG: hypothetical protein KDB27_01130 [Planctomycetales bacterium]|nr:hypothetical protein [Planctomycetales bacterium]